MPRQIPRFKRSWADWIQFLLNLTGIVDIFSIFAVMNKKIISSYRLAKTNNMNNIPNSFCGYFGFGRPCIGVCFIIAYKKN